MKGKNRIHIPNDESHSSKSFDTTMVLQQVARLDCFSLNRTPNYFRKVLKTNMMQAKSLQEEESLYYLNLAEEVQID